MSEHTQKRTTGRGAETQQESSPHPAISAPNFLSIVELYLSSYALLLGQELVPPGELTTRAQALWSAPFVAVAHDTEADPKFIYGNRRALEVWEVSFEEFIGMPSRRSVRAEHRGERERLLRSVAERGFATGYSGERVTKSGRAFRIVDVTVFNLLSPDGTRVGQGATYSRIEAARGP